jgi:hypothetical protein
MSVMNPKDNPRDSIKAEMAGGISLCILLLSMLAWILLGNPPYAFYQLFKWFFGVSSLVLSVVLLRLSAGWLPMVAVLIGLAAVHLIAKLRKVEWVPLNWLAVVAILSCCLIFLSTLWFRLTNRKTDISNDSVRPENLASGKDRVASLRTKIRRGCFLTIPVLFVGAIIFVSSVPVQREDSKKVQILVDRKEWIRSKIQEMRQFFLAIDEAIVEEEDPDDDQETVRNDIASFRSLIESKEMLVSKSRLAIDSLWEIEKNLADDDDPLKLRVPGWDAKGGLLSKVQSTRNFAKSLVQVIEGLDLKKGLTEYDNALWAMTDSEFLRYQDFAIPGPWYDSYVRQIGALEEPSDSPLVWMVGLPVLSGIGLWLLVRFKMGALTYDSATLWLKESERIVDLEFEEEPWSPSSLGEWIIVVVWYSGVYLCLTFIPFLVGFAAFYVCQQMSTYGVESARWPLPLFMSCLLLGILGNFKKFWHPVDFDRNSWIEEEAQIDGPSMSLGSVCLLAGIVIPLMLKEDYLNFVPWL